MNAPMMTMRAVADGAGGVRHIPAPYVAPAKGRKRTPPDPIKTTGDASAEQLRLLLERIERLEEEKQGISDDIKDVYSEAKSTGFDVTTMRTIIKLRRMESHHREEADLLLETYRASLGML